MAGDAHLRVAARHAALHRRRSGRPSSALGHARGRRSCARQDVRLTMGGEPTFVSVDDRDGAEWNTDALGPTKRGFATELVHRLLAKYGAGRLPALRPGQVVPGRAAAALGAVDLLARRRPALLARPVALRRRARDPPLHHAPTRRPSSARSTQRLGLDPKYVHPGYEDTCYYLWRERRLPVNVDPFDSRLDDELERAAPAPHLRAGAGQRRRLRAAAAQGVGRGHGRAGLDHRRLVPARRAAVPDPRRFADGLPAAAGFAALGQGRGPAAADRAGPVRAAHALAQRGVAALADARLRRAPCRPRLCRGRRGGAAGPGRRRTAGAWAAAGRRRARRWRAPRRTTRSRRVRRTRTPCRARHESAGWITRTALCVEVRDPQRANGPKAEVEHGGKSGVMYVFMPPLQHLEDYLELVAGGRGHGASSRA